MSDLSTTYMGLSLKNPVIAGSSGLTSTVDGIKKLEEAGAAAVVLKSLYEEEINNEAGSVIDSGGDANIDNTAQEYISYYIKQQSVHNYLQLISDLKKTVKIPIIASINCASAESWIEFAAKIEKAGADALEINIFIIPSDPSVKTKNMERIYFDIARKVTRKVSIPVSLKLSSYFTALTHTFVELSETPISGMVLFNRFFSPDIDLSKMEIVSSNIYSEPNEISIPLRWIGMLSEKVNCDLAASTGIHDGDGVIKMLLVGAQAVQVTSALYKYGPEQISEMLKRLEFWMETNKYKTINDFRGKLTQEKIGDPTIFERFQFMKYFSDHKS